MNVPARPQTTPPLVKEAQPGNKLAETILDFVGAIPNTHETRQAWPAERVRAITAAAASKAAVTAGALALPPGPFGWLTILPELIAIWRIQAQMVADIAGAYGKVAFLTREGMLYTLFRHTAAQAVRDLVVRMGQRFLIRTASAGMLRGVARKVGLRITQKAVGKGVTRWLPIVGAMGVGAYAYYDTKQVAETAVELFEREIVMENGGTL